MFPCDEVWDDDDDSFSGSCGLCQSKQILKSTEKFSPVNIFKPKETFFDGRRFLLSEFRSDLVAWLMLQVQFEKIKFVHFPKLPEVSLNLTKHNFKGFQPDDRRHSFHFSPLSALTAARCRAQRRTCAQTL